MESRGLVAVGPLFVVFVNGPYVPSELVCISALSIALMTNFLDLCYEAQVGSSRTTFGCF